MKIATWNVNGIRAREAQLCDWLERDQPDVLCLQELKAEPSQIPERCNLADYHVFWHGHRGYSGVSLHIRKNLVDAGPEFSHPEFDMGHIAKRARQPGPRLSLRAQRQGLFRQAGLPEPACRVGQASDLRERAGALRRHQHRAPTSTCTPRSEAGVIGQRRRASFRSSYSEKPASTSAGHSIRQRQSVHWWPPWRNMRQRNIGWRIDYILASRSIAARATNCEVLADIGTSDHAPVMMTIT
jgi:exodeoxyribonuclease-3